MGYRGVAIETRLVDITSLNVDAIVNAANTRLYMGGGVAGAIKRKGGQDIEDEAVSKGPIKIGEAVETSSGGLPSKFVIHSPTMELDFRTDEKKIRLAIRAALNKAEKLGIRSIAFPSLGTGVGGFSREEAARIMVKEIKNHIDEKTSEGEGAKKTPIEKILLTDINEPQVNAFKKYINEFLDNLKNS